jgi:SAM-dependent methyltransferase
MAFEDVMGQVMQWITATEALAALGAELATQQPGAQAPPEIAVALEGVSAAAGIGGLAELPPPQQQMILSIIRMYLHQANDLLEHPDRAPGWTFTDPVILEGWGRGSALVPPMIATAHADLAELGSFLDVGTGVGWLAVAAANQWPDASVVGIDSWSTSLERARANVASVGLEDRITLREQDLTELSDVGVFDCAWLPSFFLNEGALTDGLGVTHTALRPGGWVVLGRMRPAASPLATAVTELRTIRGGGSNLDTDTAVALLEKAGFVDVHVAPSAGPSPMELVLGQRPTA